MSTNDQAEPKVGFGIVCDLFYWVLEEPDGRIHIQFKHDHEVTYAALKAAGAKVEILDNVGDRPHVKVMAEFLASVPRDEAQA